MSMDIRKFLTSPAQKNQAAKTSQLGNKKKTTNSRKRALIESDSDNEDDNFKTPKKSKQKESPKSNKKNKDGKKSKYFENSKDISRNFFGSQPIKQTKPDVKEKSSSNGKKEELWETLEGLSDDALDEVLSVENKNTPSKDISDVEINEKPKQPTLPEKISTRSSPVKISPKKKFPKSKTTVKTPNKTNSNGAQTPDKTPTKRNIKSVEEENENVKVKKGSDGSRVYDKNKTNDKNDNKTKEVKNSEVKSFKQFVPDQAKPPVLDLWVDKYKPTNLKALIGQQGNKSVANKLVHWLKNWHRNQFGNVKPLRPSPWLKDYDGAFYKAALLSGPPGIGKTTTAHLVCKELNMDLVEYNASCTRSKKMLHDEITELLTSKSLSHYAHGGSSTSKTHVLIMDEVDGMAGNEDRGGVQELISLIKCSKVPIICMCNDRNHPKIRSLSNYCFDLRVNRPRMEQIKGAMLSICFKEGLKIKPNILTDIIMSTNQDIRLVLNNLSLLAARNDASMNVSAKDLKLGAWDVVRKVFSEEENKNMSIHDKCDLFFNDYSIAPLFVQENYLQVTPHSKEANSKIAKMKMFAKTATSLCYGDLIDNGIRTHNAWSLLPIQAIFSSVIPGATLSGHMGGQINFPSWLGKNSKRGKFDRMYQEIQVHTRLKTSGAKDSIISDYSYALKEAVVAPLVTEGSGGIEKSLDVMRQYMLVREDLDSLIELTTWTGGKNKFADLESKVKAAFTRAYNKCPVLTPCSVINVKKMKVSNDDDIMEGEEEEMDIDSEDVNDDDMILIKKKNKDTSQIKEKKQKAGPSKPRGGKKGGKK
ncbi:replication factor C subunit 1-like [Cimex lectularius]|uniref:Activator 1 large subunit n=1 Tax=Cimex lectularius TaxID=79782 RepID=A0A8I6RKE5_CIMLE|nr:replication factor C subunit 1-like [Cimex lectularius]